MGNKASCFGWKAGKRTANQISLEQGLPADSKSPPALLEEDVVHQQAIALLLHQEMARAYTHSSYRRSTSQRVPSSKPYLPRSASARPQAANDPVLHPQQLLRKSTEKVSFANLETNKFVLIHGGGFGAWCWYKSVALLEEAGFVTAAVDLSGSGIDSINPNEVSSMKQYSKPLCDFLERLPDDEKVNLVGHSLGGPCISYVTECYPHKIAKAIFVAALVVKNGQGALDILAPEVSGSGDVLQNLLVFVSANGNSYPPTSMELNKTLMKNIFFNRTALKDVSLAGLSIRPIPFAPFAEKLSLTEENYGRVRKFYIQTMDDHVFTPTMQESMLDSNPPEQVFKLKGSDHCPFFSKPLTLHSLLVEIAQLGPKKS